MLSRFRAARRFLPKRDAEPIFHSHGVLTRIKVEVESRRRDGVTPVARVIARKRAKAGLVPYVGRCEEERVGVSVDFG